ncbi:phage tail assembly chaperone [Bradyrhizobium sp. Leo170]|uniref:phage tail assembly chaperone n=1 Tax=Bradyrhizobium sp. Leo170 TaxID=1571199 RepID=UPI00102E9F7F|nr:phage tail assembly chaperone [Bradyrhizobium sp. Leo170]
MRLADDTFKLTLETRSFTLRPSLRAAFNLNHKYDGFHALSHSIADGSFSACSDLIAECCTDPNGWVLYSMKAGAVREVLAARGQLIEFILVLIGAQDKTGGDKPQAGKPISFDEYFTQLFQIGTGWLGWSPAETWNATPAEIINAKRGRNAMLEEIFGRKSEDQAADVADGSFASVKGDLNAIGDLTNHVRPR